MTSSETRNNKNKTAKRTSSKTASEKGPKARGTLLDNEENQNVLGETQMTQRKGKGPKAKGSLLPEGPEHLQPEENWSPKKSNAPKAKGPKARGTL